MQKKIIDEGQTKNPIERKEKVLLLKNAKDPSSSFYL